MKAKSKLVTSINFRAFPHPSVPHQRIVLHSSSQCHYIIGDLFTLSIKYLDLLLYY